MTKAANQGTQLRIAWHSEGLRVGKDGLSPACKVQQFCMELCRMCLIRDQGDAMRRTKGFSLIELLIVVAIILIISAIPFPSFLLSRIPPNKSPPMPSVRPLNTP